MIYNKKNFLIASLAPGDKERENLGVHVTHKWTEVTNGHYAVRVAVPPNGEGKLEIPKNRNHGPIRRKRINVSISKSAAEAVLKGIPGSGSDYASSYLDMTWVGRRSNEKETEFISAEHGITKSATVENLETKFPDVDNMIKLYGLKRKAKMVIGFSPEYLKKICDYFIRAKVPQVKMSIYSPDKPVKIEDPHDGGKNKDRQAIQVILMPSILPEHNRKKASEDSGVQKTEEKEETA